jgi:hypothetical protein
MGDRGRILDGGRNFLFMTRFRPAPGPTQHSRGLQNLRFNENPIQIAGTVIFLSRSGGRPVSFPARSVSSFLTSRAAGEGRCRKDGTLSTVAARPHDMKFGPSVIYSFIISSVQWACCPGRLRFNDGRGSFQRSNGARV